jgi:hypothetical protein
METPQAERNLRAIKNEIAQLRLQKNDHKHQGGGERKANNRG